MIDNDLLYWVLRCCFSPQFYWYESMEISFLMQRCCLLVVLCFTLFTFTWTGVFLVMTQLCSRVVPWKKTVMNNPSYEFFVDFVVHTTTTCVSITAGSVFCRLISIIFVQNRVQSGPNLKIVEYEDDRIRTYLSRWDCHSLTFFSTYMSSLLPVVKEVRYYFAFWWWDRFCCCCLKGGILLNNSLSGQQPSSYKFNYFTN